MSEITKDRLLEIIIRALPYSEQMTKIDTTSESDAIRFSWRSQDFRVTVRLTAETVEPSILVSGDVSILLEALLKRTFVAMSEYESKVSK